uniref:Uncharacterized protein n=1 Tax=Aegilops tauschii subsp. strangulata TaxID=200361 RepID=A0A453PA81_AEGTS
MPQRRRWQLDGKRELTNSQARASERYKGRLSKPAWQSSPAKHNATPEPLAAPLLSHLPLSQSYPLCFSRGSWDPSLRWLSYLVPPWCRPGSASPAKSPSPAALTP